jgi:protein SCO1/2
VSARVIALAAGAALLALEAPAWATAAAADQDDLPPALQGVNVEERLDARVPLSAAFLDSEGKPVRLRDLVRGDRPVVMSLVYYECPMLCGLVLGGLERGLRQTGLELGRDYRAATISFDPREKPAQALVRQKVYLQALGKPDARPDWPFLVGAEPDIRSVADAVGFHYKYDEASRQYAHAAAIFVLTPEGKVSRYLYGVEYPGRDLRLALVEAGQGRVGTSFDKFLLTCYRYDPAARKYVPYALGLVRAGALLVLFGLAGTLAFFWRREVSASRLARARREARDFETRSGARGGSR